MHNFYFPAFMFPEFCDKLTKLNKKLKKMDNANEVEIVSRIQTPGTVLTESGKVINAMYDNVTVSNPLILKRPDFKFVATVKFQGENKFIYAINNEQVSHLDLSPRCDHCNTNRQRKKVHIFKHTDGSHKIIGHTCADDYFGLKINNILNTFFNFMESTNNSIGTARLTTHYFDINAVINAARMEHSMYPFYHKGSTPEHARHNISSNDNEPLNHMDEINTIKDKLLLEFGNIKPENSNFESNMVNAMFYHINGINSLKDYVTSRAIGIITYAVYKVLNNKKNPNRVNKHIGTIGEVITVEGKVLRKKECHSNYGTSTLVVLDTDEGEVSFFSQKKFAIDLEIDSNTTVTGKIKDHKDFKGHLSTQLNYVKEVE